jgi:putative ABC transport system permease protein
MIKNWFTTAWRNLKKNKTSGLLNIAGLSIGMACFLLMALYVLDELQYDRYNTQADNIYRIDQQVKFGDFKYHGAWVPAIMGPAFTKDFPQVTQYTRLRYNPGIVIRKGAESIVEDAVHADSSLFDVFTLPMLAGDAGTALKEPHSLVLTEKAARKYFSSTDVVGKQLTINDSVNYTITGVIRDIPRLSHFNVDFFMAASELPESRNASWFNCNFQTYLVCLVLK